MLFRRIDVGMAEHARHQIDAIRFLIKTRAVSTAELVRRNLFQSSYCLGIFFHKVFNGSYRDTFVLEREEKGIFISFTTLVLGLIVITALLTSSMLHYSPFDIITYITFKMILRNESDCRTVCLN